MKRRHFIGMAAAGAAGLVLPSSASVPTSACHCLNNPRLPGFLRDRDVMRELGRRYRAMVPAESSPESLAAIFQQALRIDLDRPPPADLAARLETLVRQDFAAGRTVIVNGWMLAVTEARQCALSDPL